jgi:hypothetical protein
MDYKAKIIADSIGPNGVRLTTMEFDIWKPLLAEFNTHGLLGSRNFPSSRAIPWPKMREKILNHPHVPMFRKNNPGMQPGAPLSDEEQAIAAMDWLFMRDRVLQTVETMGAKDGLNIHKQWLNRALEPWIVVTGLVTATDWDNFFNLRLELNDDGYPMAQDEFYFMTRAMKKALEESTPNRLEFGDWHLPYVNDILGTCYALRAIDVEDSYNNLAMVSAGMCATVSYDNLGNGIDHIKDYKRATEMLLPFGHMSVFQHQAICRDKCDIDGDYTANQFSGQLRGWVQFRKTLRNEGCWVSPNADKELALTLPDLITE